MSKYEPTRGSVMVNTRGGEARLQCVFSILATLMASAPVFADLRQIVHDTAGMLTLTGGVKRAVPNIVIFLACGDGNTEMGILFYLIAMGTSVTEAVFFDISPSSNMAQRWAEFGFDKIRLTLCETFGALCRIIVSLRNTGHHMVIHGHNMFFDFEKNTEVAEFVVFIALMKELSAAKIVAPVLSVTKIAVYDSTVSFLRYERGDLSLLGKITEVDRGVEINTPVLMLLQSWDDVLASWLPGSKELTDQRM